MNDVISIVYIFRKITNDTILVRVKRMYCLYKYTTSGVTKCCYVQTKLRDILHTNSA